MNSVTEEFVAVILLCGRESRVCKKRREQIRHFTATYLVPVSETVMHTKNLELWQKVLDICYGWQQSKRYKVISFRMRVDSVEESGQVGLFTVPFPLLFCSVAGTWASLLQQALLAKRTVVLLRASTSRYTLSDRGGKVIHFQDLLA